MSMWRLSVALETALFCVARETTNITMQATTNAGTTAWKPWIAFLSTSTFVQSTSVTSPQMMAAHAAGAVAFF